MNIVGRWTELHPLRAADRPWLYETATSPAISPTWRLGGTTPSPADFERVVTDDVTAQAIIWSRATTGRIGFLQLYHVDWVGRTGYLAVLIEAGSWTLGWPLEAVVLFLDHAFTELGLRKVYLEAAGPTYERFSSAAAQWLTVESVLHDHFRPLPGSGDPGAVASLSISADDWDHETVRRLLRRSPAASSSTVAAGSPEPPAR